MTRRWIPCGCLVLALLAPLGCERRADGPADAAAAVRKGDRPTLPARRPPTVERFQVVNVEIEQRNSDDQRVQGLDDAQLLAELTPVLAGLPLVRGVGPLPKGVAPTDQVGLAAVVSWQVVDLQGSLGTAAKPPEWGQLIVSVVAHAERAVEDDQAPVAERAFTATVPMPPERAAEFRKFLISRLGRALELATNDVLAELWARQLTDAQVLDTLDTRVLWRKVAAAREVGERGLRVAREDLEAAARDPRQDLAAVAAAALGRIGHADSVPVLEKLLDSDHTPVVDAALASLADIGNERAIAVLHEAAAGHPNVAIRQRAAALLQERAARPTGPRLDP